MDFNAEFTEGAEEDVNGSGNAEVPPTPVCERKSAQAREGKGVAAFTVYKKWKQARAKPNPQAMALMLLARRYPDTLERLERLTVARGCSAGRALPPPKLFQARAFMYRHPRRLGQQDLLVGASYGSEETAGWYR